MDNEIFRKKSLDRMSAPDSLNNTIQVIAPSVWLLLTAMILIICGFVIWAVFGTLNSTVDTIVVSKNGNAGCYVRENDMSEVKTGMEIVIEDDIYELGEIVEDKCVYADSLDAYVAHIGKYDNNDYLYYFIVLGDVPEGSYQGEIITEKINAISFLWN